MQLTLVRANGKKTNDDTIRQQVEYIVKRGLDSTRGKAWKCQFAEGKPPHQKEGLWVFTYVLTFEKVDGYRGDSDKRFDEIKEMIAQTGAGTKFGEYPWKLDNSATPVPAPAPVGVTIVEPPTIKATASPIITSTKVVEKPVPVEPEEEDEDEDVDDTPVKAALTGTAAPVKPQKPLTPKKLRKILARSSVRDVVLTLFDSVSWDRLMLEMANLAHGRSAGMPRKSAKAKMWISRGRVFHRAMDEQILSKVKGGIFKITRRDIYECKCKKRFVVDPAREKNIKFDIGQCEYVVTCPHCGKQEDVKKAREVFKKLESKE
jgi:hypothetical protein